MRKEKVRNREIGDKGEKKERGITIIRNTKRRRAENNSIKRQRTRRQQSREAEKNREREIRLDEKEEKVYKDEKRRGERGDRASGKQRERGRDEERAVVEGEGPELAQGVHGARAKEWRTSNGRFT